MSASGSDAKSTAGSSTARSREHNQGNQGRDVTPEQHAAVQRIRKCSATAFYDILGLEAVRTTATESDIKKAYRKQSLLTHPDKNGHEHADEAFKIVSRAFSVLSDKDKRATYDRYGTDPDNRFGGPPQNPFAGGGGRPGFGGQQGHMFEGEITPEELFRQFFGGGGGGFGGGPFAGFDAGPQFMFNFGGGPGFRVHQFGGGRPQRRPGTQPGAGGARPAATPASTLQTLLGLLPIFFFFIMPLLSNLLSGLTSSSNAAPATPRMVFDSPVPPMTLQRELPRFGVPYFVDPAAVATYSPAKLRELDRAAEGTFVRVLRAECGSEAARREQLVYEAQGWFFDDKEKMEAARHYHMPSCRRLQTLGLSR
ncbi:DUF1977-domain-containing protein [Ceratocystis lukuohia]|uniref:DUF1977-domain-containing protein n=2 Tax=Ceratocystis TaxID=5157 RepID=A0ABR4MFJ2_9PEZI|nr:putative J domain-containing protein C17A3.05c [Ceratocystis fimbriata CBS 114723]